VEVCICLDSAATQVLCSAELLHLSTARIRQVAQGSTGLELLPLVPRSRMVEGLRLQDCCLQARRRRARFVVPSGLRLSTSRTSSLKSYRTQFLGGDVEATHESQFPAFFDLLFDLFRRLLFSEHLNRRKLRRRLEALQGPALRE